MKIIEYSNKKILVFIARIIYWLASQLNMVIMQTSNELEFSSDKFIGILTNYENLSGYLPRQLQKIEIIEKNENLTKIKAVIFLRSLIKQEFVLEIEIEEKSYGLFIANILDGIAKGTKITITISEQNMKTLCDIETDVKLSLKTIVLLPIIKREYKGFVQGILSNILNKVNKKE